LTQSEAVTVNASIAFPVEERRTVPSSRNPTGIA